MGQEESLQSKIEADGYARTVSDVLYCLLQPGGEAFFRVNDLDQPVYVNMDIFPKTIRLFLNVVTALAASRFLVVVAGDGRYELQLLYSVNQMRMVQQYMPARLMFSREDMAAYKNTRLPVVSPEEFAELKEAASITLDQEVAEVLLEKNAMAAGHVKQIAGIDMLMNLESDSSVGTEKTVVLPEHHQPDPLLTEKLAPAIKPESSKGPEDIVLTKLGLIKLEVWAQKLIKEWRSEAESITGYSYRAIICREQREVVLPPIVLETIGAGLIVHTLVPLEFRGGYRLTGYFSKPKVQGQKPAFTAKEVFLMSRPRPKRK